MTYEEAMIIIGNIPIYEKTMDGCYTVAEYQEAKMMAINALYEVQKHEETFEWCTDCKEYDQEKHCCHRWTKCIRETVEEIKENDRDFFDKYAEESTIVMGR